MFSALKSVTNPLPAQTKCLFSQHLTQQLGLPMLQYFKIVVIAFLFIQTLVFQCYATPLIPEGIRSLESVENVEEKAKRLLNRPGAISKLLKKTISLIKSKEYNEAISTAAEEIKVNPNAAFAYELMGVAYAQQGQFNKALKALKKAEKLLPKDAPLLTTIGNLYAQEKKIKNATEYYEKALVIKSGDPFANWGLGIILAKQNKNQRAIKHLKKAHLGKTDHDTAINMTLAALYNRNSQFKEALKILDANKANAKTLPEFHIIKGNAFTGLRDFGKAIEIFLELKKIESSTERSHLLLGIAYKLDGQLEKSEKELSTAVQINPKNSLGHYHLGDLYREMGKRKKAISQFKKSLKLSPNLLGAMRGLAFTYTEMGQHNEAIRMGQEIVSQVPENSIAHYQLASYYHQAEKYTKAIQHYRKSLELNSNHLSSLNNLASLLSMGKDGLDEALQFALKAKMVVEKIDGMSAVIIGEINDTAGWIYSKKGNYAKAIEILSIATKKSPKNPSILYHLAVTYEKTDKKQQALALLKKAFTLSSSFPESKAAEKLMTHLR